MFALRSLPLLAHETNHDASKRKGAKRALNDKFREVRPLARVVLVAGFEAFNLQLYKQVVSTVPAGDGQGVIGGQPQDL